MLRWIKRIAITLIVLVGIGASIAWWAYRKTHEVPEFYTRAVASIPEDTDQAVFNVEQQVELLQQHAGRAGSWKASFSDREINAWLMQELPNKFPQLLKRGVKDPRLVIEGDRLLIAARYKDKRFDTVISFEIRAELTEEPNILALKVNNLRAGALPLPLDQFLKNISKEAGKGGVEVQWDMTDSGPVALVSVPSEHPNYAVSPVIVESVILRDGYLELAGHTGPGAQESYRPQGTVHRFVSFRPKSNRNSQRSARLSASDARNLR